MKLQEGRRRYGTVGKYCGRDLRIKRIVRERLQRRIGLRRSKNRCLCLAVICVCLLATGGLLFKMRMLLGDGEISTAISTAGSASASGKKAPSSPDERASLSLFDETDELLTQVDRAVPQCDYNGAVEPLIGNGADKENPKVGEKLSDIEAVRKTLVEQNIYQITHVFFHILVENPGRTFLDTAQDRGYNSAMTTAPEFEAILTQIYQRGYVLVGIHDLTEVSEDETGVEQMRTRKILPPPGKEAFVMSQDDISYCKHMEGSGCARKILLDDRGKPVCEYMDQGGAVWVGEYDSVPILGRFMEKHPDFSYEGAEIILALTGYNGVLGYCTDETYDPAFPNYDPGMEPNSNIEEDRTYVKKLTRALKGDGYEFASHSWGHRDHRKIGLEHTKADIERWEKNMAPLLPGPCDIMTCPFGSDVGDWGPYTGENEKYRHLQSLGFRYFCSVGSRSYWVKTGGQFLRRARRNLNGYRLWIGHGYGANRLSDLIDVSMVFDTRRPTPVGWKQAIPVSWKRPAGRSMYGGCLCDIWLFRGGKNNTD